MFDKFQDECGVFGIFGHPEAANLTYLGLYALQHRGQESCGIVAGDGKNLRAYRNMGLVSDVFKRDSIFDGLPGRKNAAHLRARYEMEAGGARGREAGPHVEVLGARQRPQQPVEDPAQ